MHRNDLTSCVNFVSGRTMALTVHPGKAVRFEQEVEETLACETETMLTVHARQIVHSGVQYYSTR
jgi:hypothetical protein